jgi:hypothetical protein
MVNGWLKLPIRGVNNGRCPAPATKRAHFRHEICVNQQSQRCPGRSEVVLDQAILGLLINGRQRLPWGIYGTRLNSGVIRRGGSLQGTMPTSEIFPGAMLAM